MRRLASTSVMAVTALTVTLVGGTVLASSRSSDEAALAQYAAAARTDEGFAHWLNTWLQRDRACTAACALNSLVPSC